MKAFSRITPERKQRPISKARYFHISRPLMQDPHGRLDFAYREVPNPLLKGVTQRMYFKGRTFNIGANMAKRQDKLHGTRHHILARLDARKHRSVK